MKNPALYRFLLTVISVLAFSTGAFAQQKATVTATLIDSLTREGQFGALVELTSISDPSKIFRTLSSVQGAVTIKEVPFGSYQLRVWFLGFVEMTRTVRVNRPQTDLGVIGIQQDAKWLDQVEARGHALRTSQRGDTLTYNADAFKVSKDSDAEGLLAKMPGVTVIDGQVEAQGETVKKVFVDGKEFFGEDVTSAIRNLPAEIVQKVEVYNKLSDQAEFTGIDDGEGYKAINIVTHPGMRQGQFGKLYAGYGFDEKYIAGGSVNVFTGNHRISFIGLLNNLNQQNFSTEDILGVTGSSGGRGGMQGRSGGRMRSRGGGSSDGFMVPQQSGISTVGSFGVNYSAQWGRKVDFQGSYFFNTNKNENTRLTDRQYISRTDTLRFDNTTRESSSRNYNNRINARMEWKINENQSLMVRPSLSFQSYSTGSSEHALSEYFRGTENIVRTLADQLADSKSSGYNISNSMLYRAKLGKPGRTITLDGYFNFNRNDRTQTQHNFDDFQLPLPVSDSTYGQHNLNESFGYRLSGSAIYTEPITEKSQVSLQYRVSYSYSDADRRTFLWDEFANRFNPDFDENLSNVYNSGYTTHRVGPGYRLNTPKSNLSLNVFLQRSTLTGDQDYPVLAANNLSQSFSNVVYFGMWHLTFNPNNTLRMFLRSSTDNPSVSDLQDVVNVSNSRSVSVGNPALSPSYSHSLSTHYIRSNTAKGRTFMLMGGVSLKNGSIVDSTLNVGRGGMVINGVEISPLARVTKPINMDGDWNARAMINFGFPVGLLKSNLNLYTGLTYAESPAMIDGEKNLSKGQYYSGGAVLGSNISEKIDFTISYNGGYNIVKNTIQTGTSDNEYFSHSANVRFKWVMWAGFTLSGGTSYMQYKGITDNYNEEYTLIHLYLGKKIFKNQRGELMFGVNDLLDQNKSFSRNVTAQYIENVTNRVIGRYWGLQFNYNLRNFGKRGSRGNVDPESFTRSTDEGAGRPGDGPRIYRGPGGGPGGPPPGGGPGGPGGGF